jgi:hypothetical protein
VKVKIEGDFLVVEVTPTRMVSFEIKHGTTIKVPLETVTAAYVEANRDSEICPCKPCMEKPKKYKRIGGCEDGNGGA